LARNPRRRWNILATALTTMFALVMPMAGGSSADTSDNTFVLNVEPELGVNQPGDMQTITATIETTGGCDDPGDSQCHIDFEIEGNSGDGPTPGTPDFGCFVPQTATQCTVSYTTAGAGTDKIRAWIDDDNNDGTFDADATEGRNRFSQPGETPESDDTDVVEISWAIPGEVTSVNAELETDTKKVGVDTAVNCTLRDGFGALVPAAECDVEVASGVNADNNLDNDLSTPLGFIDACTTDANGACSISYTSPDAGTDVVRVFFDENGSDTSNGGEPRDDIVRTWTTDIKSGPCAGLNYNSSRAKQGGGRIIAGSPLANTINGGPGPDTICALGGNDNVDGNGGNDHVLAGLGNDNVVGEGGDDNLDGNEGRDTLAGGDGIDSIVAGGHNDILVGGGGNDIMKGQDGTDALRGKSGADTMEGGTDADIMFGHGGNDTLKGGGGNDELDGGLGRDTCVPGPGRDQVRRCE
jgi:Ca2+-binding RTX toxin-like protein